MTDKLFDTDEEFTETEEPLQIPEDNPLQPFLAKYKDEAGIARTIIEKENFINQLKRENAELRVDLTSRSKVEETVDRLLSGKTSSGTTQQTTTSTGETSNENTNSTKPGLTEDDVKRILERERAAMQAEQNVNIAKKKLEEAYGADWQKVIAKRGKELGESKEFFDALAKKNPNALMAILGPSEKPKASTPGLFDNSVNTTSQTLSVTGGTQVRNESYYKNLKTKNSAEYWSPRVQAQMHKDAIAQGASFFN